MPVDRVFEVFSVELVKSCVVISNELIANSFNGFMYSYIRRQRGYINDSNVDRFFESEG